MLKNYFKTAWRNLTRNKMYSFINIDGIAIGLAAFWMIALYVGDEFSYDKGQPDAGRIYRVAQHASWEGGKIDLPLTAPVFAPAMQAAFPEIEYATRIDPEGGGTITMSNNNKSIKANDIISADDQFFKVFSYHFLYGNPVNALTKPQSIVITESLAVKIFGDATKALNQVINFGPDYFSTVTGVIKDIPENNHLRFSGVRSNDKL